MISEERMDQLSRQWHLYFSARNYARAASVAREIIGGNPQSALGYELAGRALLAANQSQPAKGFLRKALALEPEADALRYLLGVACRMLGETKEAEEHIRKAIELDPEQADYWTELGAICHSRQDTAGARRYAGKALKLAPGDAAALNLMGMATPSNDPDTTAEQLETYFKALAEEPEDPYILNNIGVAYLHTELHAEAEEYIRKALSLNATEGIFRKNLYLVLRRRSLVYRALRAPGDFFMAAALIISQNWWTAFLLLIPPAAFARASTGSPWARPIVFLLAPLCLWIAWCIVFWPLIKFYEYLTLSDIRAQAQEVGARRGGLLGIHGWPFGLRFAAFVAVMLGVWATIGYALSNSSIRSYVFGFLIACACALVILGLLAQRRENRAKTEATERRNAFRSLERP